MEENDSFSAIANNCLLKFEYLPRVKFLLFPFIPLFDRT